MNPKERLTNRQEEAYAFIKQCIAKTGSAPTLKEIARKMGVKSLRSVAQYLEALERKGFIERGHYETRGIKLASTLHSAEDLVQVPVFASAGCGSPSVIAQRTYGESIPIERELIEGKENVFIIKATGDSMRDAGIKDGSFVLVERTENVKNGDLVVAIIGDNAVIKKISLANNAVVLSPVSDDPRYTPMILHRNFTVFGKVMDVIKVEPSQEIQYVYEGDNNR